MEHSGKGESISPPSASQMAETLFENQVEVYHIFWGVGGRKRGKKGGEIYRRDNIFFYCFKVKIPFR